MKLAICCLLAFEDNYFIKAVYREFKIDRGIACPSTGSLYRPAPFVVGSTFSELASRLADEPTKIQADLGNRYCMLRSHRSPGHTLPRHNPRRRAPAQTHYVFFL